MKILLSLFIIVSLSSFSSTATNGPGNSSWCECGSFESGFTSWRTEGEGSGCCSGAAMEGTGIQSFWEPSGGSGYVMVEVISVSALAAQDSCCSASPDFVKF